VAKINKKGALDESANLEMSVMYRLKHANILRVKESFWSPDETGFMMLTEYCPFGSIQRQINARIDNKKAIHRNKNFSPLLIKICLHDILNALSHISSKNYIHLDIKPDNILINDASDRYSFPRFVLADFGTIRIL